MQYAGYILAFLFLPLGVTGLSIAAVQMLEWLEQHV